MDLPLLFVFDLDGTLVDSSRDIARACNHALTRFGRATLTHAVVAALVGDGARVLVAKAFGLPPSSADVDAPLASFHTFYEEHPADNTTLVPGISALLEALAPRTRLGVCTNKPRGIAMRVLTHLGIATRFEVVYAGGDGPLKPDPAGMRACCTEVGVSVERAALVGDSPQDVLAGRAAGAMTIALATEIFGSADTLRAAEPDLIFADPAALLAHFASLGTPAIATECLASRRSR